MGKTLSLAAVLVSGIRSSRSVADSQRSVVSGRVFPPLLPFFNRLPSRPLLSSRTVVDSKWLLYDVIDSRLGIIPTTPLWMDDYKKSHISSELRDRWLFI